MFSCVLTRLKSLGAIRAEQFDAELLDTDGANSGIFSRSNQAIAEAGAAGEIDVAANFMLLDREGAIASSSAAVTGGDIFLNVPDAIVLRRNSEISTSAGTAFASGDGGGIDIDTGVLVAFPFENADITSNAFEGGGGRINVVAQGILGIEERSRAELIARLGTEDPVFLDPELLATSDIVAISQTNPNLNGQVTFDLPDVDSSRGTIELSEIVVDPSELIARNPCKQGSESTFTNAGRGGLPYSDDAPGLENMVRSPWSDPIPNTGEMLAIERSHHNDPPAKIVPARGWRFLGNGRVVLTPYPTETETSAHLPQRTLRTCR